MNGKAPDMYPVSSVFHLTVSGSSKGSINNSMQRFWFIVFNFRIDVHSYFTVFMSGTDTSVHRWQSWYCLMWPQHCEIAGYTETENSEVAAGCGSPACGNVLIDGSYVMRPIKAKALYRLFTDSGSNSIYIPLPPTFAKAYFWAKGIYFRCNILWSANNNAVRL